LNYKITGKLIFIYILNTQFNWVFKYQRAI